VLWCNGTAISAMAMVGREGGEGPDRPPLIGLEVALGLSLLYPDMLDCGLGLSLYVDMLDCDLDLSVEPLFPRSASHTGLGGSKSGGGRELLTDSRSVCVHSPELLVESGIATNSYFSCFDTVSCCFFK